MKLNLKSKLILILIIASAYQNLIFTSNIGAPIKLASELLEENKGLIFEPQYSELKRLVDAHERNIRSLNLSRPLPESLEYEILKIDSDLRTQIKQTVECCEKIHRDRFEASRFR